MCSTRVISELDGLFKSRSSPIYANGCLRLPRRPSIGRVTRDINGKILRCTCSFRSSNALREWMLFAAEKTFHDPRQFGRALGLSEGAIQDTMRDFPHNSREERTQMLSQWIQICQRKGEKATAHRLIEIILSSDAGCLGDAATAELLCQKLKELEPQIMEKLANGSPMSNSTAHVCSCTGESRQSMLPKRTCEAWHKLLMYAGSEAFEMAAVKKRADVHSQEIKADKEKLLQLEIAVSRLQDELKLELKKTEDLQKTVKILSYQVVRLQAHLESKAEKGLQTAGSGSNHYPKAKPARPIPPSRPIPRPGRRLRQHQLGLQTAGSGSNHYPKTKPARPIPPPRPIPRPGPRPRQHQLKKQFTYEELKVTTGVPKVLPAELDRAHLEGYLSEAEFKELFGMTYQEFQAKPKWRQDEMKKQTKLF